MSRNKQQGTEFETWTVKWLNRIGLLRGARRLAEGGSQDEGDVEFYDPYEQRWIIECKAVERLNVTRALAKARKKSPVPQRTLLAWKRLTPTKAGAKRRTPDGEAVVIVMGVDTFEDLMGRFPG